MKSEQLLAFLTGEAWFKEHCCVAPDSCTLEQKQLNMCTQSVHCCSARPKPILHIPKMQTLFACYCDCVVNFFI